jgi:hypothetical protein
MAKGRKSVPMKVTKEQLRKISKEAVSAQLGEVTGGSVQLWKLQAVLDLLRKDKAN